MKFRFLSVACMIPKALAPGCSSHHVIPHSFWLSIFPWNIKLKKVKTEVTQSCPTLCNPMDCSLPGSSLHGILQARVLEWVDISFSRGSSRSKDQTQVSHIPGRHFNLWATRDSILLPWATQKLRVGRCLKRDGYWHWAHRPLGSSPRECNYRGPEV